jgi:hypothetical protein
MVIILISNINAEYKNKDYILLGLDHIYIFPGFITPVRAVSQNRRQLENETVKKKPKLRDNLERIAFCDMKELLRAKCAKS